MMVLIRTRMKMKIHIEARILTAVRVEMQLPDESGLLTKKEMKRETKVMRVARELMTEMVPSGFWKWVVWLSNYELSHGDFS